MDQNIKVVIGDLFVLIHTISIRSKDNRMRDLALLHGGREVLFQ